VEEYPEKAREQDWDDLDAEDEFDPIMVSEYVNEIFEYLREKEVNFFFFEFILINFFFFLKCIKLYYNILLLDNNKT